MLKQKRNFTDTRSELKRLARKGPDRNLEKSTGNFPGSKTIAFAAKIKSVSANNIYNIALVELSDIGPMEIGDQIQAVNLAESFNSPGQIASGTIVMVFMTGGKNIFYCQV